MRKDLENPKHPKGFLSDMKLAFDGEIWDIQSIETGREIYSYPPGFEYRGYKYRCSRENPNKNTNKHLEKLISDTDVMSEMFKTREKNPEYFL